MTNNKRISPRKILKTRVVFQDEFSEDLVYFISSDISTSGIFIQTELPLKEGTKVFLKFSLYEGDEPVDVAAEVMRKMEQRRGPGRKKAITPGVGLKFLGLSQTDFRKIENYLSE